MLPRDRARAGLSDSGSKWEGVAARVVLLCEGRIELLRVLLRREPASGTDDSHDIAARGAPWRVYLLGLPSVVEDPSRTPSESSLASSIGIYGGPGTKEEPARPRV